MSLRTLLFVVAIVVIVLGFYLLVRGGGSKTTIKITNIGELSTTSLGLATLVVGAVLAYFCIPVDEKSEASAQVRQTQERQAASSAAPPPPLLSVSQSSTGNGSPNIINNGPVTLQVEKSGEGR